MLTRFSDTNYEWLLKCAMAYFLTTTDTTRVLIPNHNMLHILP
eukprot:UN15657